MKSKPKANTSRVSKRVKQNIASLDAYSSSNALNNSLMNTIKTLYTSRDITNIKTAKSALALLFQITKTDFNRISKNSTTIMNQTTKKDVPKHIKRRRAAMQEDEEDKQLIRVVEHKIYKPKVKHTICRHISTKL